MKINKVCVFLPPFSLLLILLCSFFPFFLSHAEEIDVSWYEKKPSASEFYLHTPEELKGLSSLVNAGITFSGQRIVLTSNIDVTPELADSEEASANADSSDDPSYWIPIGSEKTPFCGTFSGNSYSITGIEVRSEQSCGLFGYSKGVIENISILNAGIEGESQLGSIVGLNAGTVRNCYSNASVTGSSIELGGIVGRNEGRVEGCIFQGTVTGGFYCGGICGYEHHSTTSNSINYGTIFSSDVSSAIGGISGLLRNASINNCQNAGIVSGQAISIGGIAGENCSVNGNSSIMNCENKGVVSGNRSSQALGGIVGKNQADNGTSDVTNCINRSDMLITDIFIYYGGICGKNQGNTSGRAQALLSNNMDLGTISSSMTTVYAAHIAGQNSYGNVENCYYLRDIPKEPEEEEETPVKPNPRTPAGSSNQSESPAEELEDPVEIIRVLDVAAIGYDNASQKNNSAFTPMGETESNIFIGNQPYLISSAAIHLLNLNTSGKSELHKWEETVASPSAYRFVSYPVVYHSNDQQNEEVITEEYYTSGLNILPDYEVFSPRETCSISGYSYRNDASKPDTDITKNNLVTMNDSGLDLYAHWKYPDCIVTLMDGEDVLKTLSIPYASNITGMDRVTKEGCQFIGWYTDSALTAVYRTSTPVTENLTLYSKWETAKYLVSFSTGMESLAFSSQMLEYGKTIVQPVLPEREGYEFEGWYTDETYTRLWDFSTDTVSSSMMLYAKWKQKSYTITFVKNGGSKVAAQTVSFGGFAVQPQKPSRLGYLFQGWYTNKKLTKKFSFSTVIKSNLKLYAKWKLNVISDKAKLKKGSNVLVSDVVYTILNVKKRTVLWKMTTNLSQKSLIIPAKVTIRGKKYTVKRVGNQALTGLSKLKTITLGKKIVWIGKNILTQKTLKTIIFQSKKVPKIKQSLKSVKTSVKIKTPKKKAAAYRKQLRKVGLSKKVSVSAQ